MGKRIFCSNCGGEILYTSVKCKCGHTMTTSEKNSIDGKVQKVGSTQLISKRIINKAQTNFSDLSNYNLSSYYVIASSAKDDFRAKSKFIKDQLLPSINEWKSSLENAGSNLDKDVVEVYGRIYSITEFVLKEFIGPFRVKGDNNLQMFIEARDFSRYELKQVLIDSDVDFSNLDDVSLGSIGSSMATAAFNTLQYGSFNELSKKSEWSKSDINKVKAEVGVAVATELISGVANLISQNSEAIKNVRKADKELNGKIAHISDVINSMEIESNEIEKKKILFDKCDIILDVCFERILKPIVEELNKDEVYLDYKEKRRPFDLQQNKIGMDELALNENIKVSFWTCLLGTKTTNFRIFWKKRMKSLGKLDDYHEINNQLNEGIHKSLKGLNDYKETKMGLFEEFEKDHRRTLNKLPAIVNNHQDVIKFAAVLKMSNRIF